MSVKAIEKKEFAGHSGGAKRELLAADIREIIQNRIEYCEFENFPYSDKTSITDIQRHTIPVFADEFKRESGSLPKGYTTRYWQSGWKPPFIMKRAKDENGVHVYGTFYVKAWEKEIREMRDLQSSV